MTAIFLSEANRLKNIQVYLEKNNALLNLSSKYECEFNLLDYFLEVEKKRKNEIDQINNELKFVLQTLKCKKKILEEGNLHGLDLTSFKNELIEIQDKIHSLRLKLLTNGDNLEEQEKSLSDLIEIFNHKLDEWENPPQIMNHRHFTAVKNTLKSKSEHKEIAVFMDFVNESGGHENGWSSEDHQLFLKLLNKHKNNIEAVANNLHKLLPDLSIEAVKEHYKWFKKYQFLKTQRDEAITKWRQSKQENHKENNTELGPQKIKSGHLKKLNDVNIHEQIEKWKAEKEARKERERYYEQMKKEKQKRIEDERRRVHNEIKQAVNKWREAITIKEQKEKFRKEVDEYHQKRIRAATANKMIRKFQSQDDLLMAKIRANKVKENNQKKKRSKSSYVAERDPDRILKPTKQWILRTRKDNSFNEVPPISRYVPNIREIPRLKVPEWRKVNQI